MIFNVAMLLLVLRPLVVCAPLSWCSVLSMYVESYKEPLYVTAIPKVSCHFVRECFWKSIKNLYGVVGNNEVNGEGGF